MRRAKFANCDFDASASLKLMNTESSHRQIHEAKDEVFLMEGDAIVLKERGGSYYLLFISYSTVPHGGRCDCSQRMWSIKLSSTV
jgi:hypothetical protein